MIQNYLTNKQKINCISSNKNHGMNSLKFIASQELSKEISHERRLQIWKSLLQIGKIKKMFNYFEIKSQVENICPYNNKNSNMNIINEPKEDRSTVDNTLDFVDDDENLAHHLSDYENLDQKDIKENNIQMKKLEKIEKKKLLKSINPISSNDDNLSVSSHSISDSVLKSFEVILLDVYRTFFRVDPEIKRIAISNILKALIYVNPAVSYCQGMSYIAAFIFEFTQNEEDSFLILLGLFTNTNYCEIFYKDLYKLKQFFLILDKAVQLKLPECQQYLSASMLNSSFYSARWFITLFTCSLQSIVDYENPKFLLTIWDKFILHGWGAIISTSLVIMKNYSEEILMLKFEDLLDFLNNDVLRTRLIQNSDNNRFLDLYNSIEFDEKCFKTLEALCVLEEKNSKN